MVSEGGYRFGMHGMERDDEWRGITGSDYDFSGYGYDALTGRRKRRDPHQNKYPSISLYASFNNNPIIFIDPDGRDVFPTNDFKSYRAIYTVFKLTTKNSVFRNVMKAYYNDYAHIWVHAKSVNTRAFNMAHTEAPWTTVNPTGQHRIVINTAVLHSSNDLAMDKTLFFMAILHEGIHARLNERIDTDEERNNLYQAYPGYYDYLMRQNIPDGEKHHTRMGAFNRDELVTGMKEFDEQLKEAGETVPKHHTEDWYQAMSWYGLRRTDAWTEFKKNNPDKAKIYNGLINIELVNITLIKSSLPAVEVIGSK